MTQVTIRQSGGANIISIPKVIIRTLALDAGVVEQSATPEEISLYRTKIFTKVSCKMLWFRSAPPPAYTIFTEDYAG